MPLRLDLGTLGEGEAHAAQHLHGLIEDEGQRMQSALGQGTGRQGGIDRGEGGGVLFCDEVGAGRLERRGDGLAHLVQLLADVLLLVGGHVAHAGGGGGEAALLSEKGDAHLLERGLVGDPGDGGEGFVLNGVELGEHGKKGWAGELSGLTAKSNLQVGLHGPGSAFFRTVSPTGHKDAAGSGANRVYSPGRPC